MTQPVPVGFPDWGRFAARATKVYHDASVAVSGTPVTLGRFFVGDVPYLTCSVADAGPALAITASFHSESTGGTETYSIGMTVGNGRFMRVSIPVVGPWAQFDLFTAGDTGDRTLTVAGSWTPASGHAGDVADPVMLTTTSSVNAGATVLTNSGTFWPGMASVILGAPSGPARMELAVLNVLGQSATFHEMSVLVANEVATSLTMVPPGIIRLSRTNLHSAAQAVRVRMVGRPIGPGW